MDEQLLNTDELALRYRVSRDTIVRWRKLGMPCMKGPRRVIFRPSQTDAWLEIRIKEI